MKKFYIIILAHLFLIVPQLVHSYQISFSGSGSGFHWDQTDVQWSPQYGYNGSQYGDDCSTTWGFTILPELGESASGYLPLVWIIKIGANVNITTNNFAYSGIKPISASYDIFNGGNMTTINRTNISTFSEDIVMKFLAEIGTEYTLALFPSHGYIEFLDTPTPIDPKQDASATLYIERYAYSQSLQIDSQSVPEPASIILIGLGILGLAGFSLKAQ